MRISELAEVTGVPVHTLKFYLREGVLPPGAATSRTRADYGEAHVERVRLVRALVEHGGVSIGDIRSIVEALDSPPPSRHELLGVAHRTLPGVTAGAEVSAEVVDLLDSLGWTTCTDGPLAAGLTAAVSAARGAGVELAPAELRRYAEAMRAAAEVDVEVALRATSAADALRTVVLGTVMVDPVLVTLRRIAQEGVSAERG